MKQCKKTASAGDWILVLAMIMYLNVVVWKFLGQKAYEGAKEFYDEHKHVVLDYAKQIQDK